MTPAIRRRPFLPLFVVPAALVAIAITAGLAAILRFSLHAYVPGSLDVGGFTLDNFADLARPIVLRAMRDTVLICFETALATLILGYPVAYALVRTRSALLKSVILVTAVTPLFLGEVVRTYAWTVVLGNSGFINATLRQFGLIDRPIQFMFTEFGVVVALVHVTLPVMVIMLAAALAHIDRDYEKAAQSLGAGPVRAFLTVTLPLSMPGVVAGFTTAFAWTFSAFATPQVIGGGKVGVVSTLVYQLGLSSFNFPVAASLSLAGLGLALGTMWAVRLAARPLEAMGGH
jgi:putative spermidine/putrescine transport system permease protein